MVSRLASSPIVCVVLIVFLALCATRIRSASEMGDPAAVVSEPTPGADVPEGAPSTKRENLGDVPHRVRDHAGAARFVAQRRVRAPHGP